MVAEGDRDGLLGAITQDGVFYGLAGVIIIVIDNFGAGDDFLLVDGGDAVARLDTGLGGGRIFNNFGNEDRLGLNVGIGVNMELVIDKLGHTGEGKDGEDDKSD